MRRYLLATTFLAFALPAAAQTFTVSASGGFAAPDGQPWNMRGLNAGVQDALQGFPNVLTDFPGLTAIRLNVNPSGDSAASISQVVSEYTAAGVAVEIEDHSGNGDNVAWYQQEAQQFKTNSLVFLETPNEPSGSAQQVAQDQTGIIKAIRATGFANPIGVQPVGGFDQSNIPGVTAAVGTANLYVTPHIYYDGTDPNGAANYVQSEIGQAQSNGLFSVIDEFGNALDGVNQNPQGNSVIASVVAAENAGEAGAIFWGMDNGNHADGADSAFATPDGSKLTPIGQQLQLSFLAARTPSTVRLTSDPAVSFPAVVPPSVAPMPPGAVAPTFQATPSAGAQPALTPVTLPPVQQFPAEPQVAVSPLQCGLFGVVGGQIFGPSGQPFRAQGIDILQSTIGNIVTGPDGGPLLQNFPNTNMVRIAMESGYGPLDQATLNAINWLTAKGIVVELGNYNIFQTAPVGQDLQNEVNWFSQLATEFKNNPYVWFSTANEPQNTPGNASDEQLTVYNAIRATGNTSMVGLDLIGGESPTDFDKSVYAQMSNVHWDAHYYNWQAGYSADLGTNVATLQNEISALAPITDKDGVIPTIVGEFGNATDGDHIDPGGSAAAQAVLDVAPTYSGSTAWVYYWPGNMDAGMPGDELTNQDTGQLTPYGHEIAAGMSPANQPPVCTESPSLAMTPINSLSPALNMPGVPSQ
jgi:Cellulase (glycosyl hydrolase family 5)